MVKLKIDGSVCEVRENSTVAEACAAAGKPFPEACRRVYKELSGVVRLNFVEVRGRDGIVDADVEKVVEGMEIVTDSVRLKAVRGRAVRLMLAGHPAECGICEKAGECLLQDVCFQTQTRNNGYEKTPPPPDCDTGPLVAMHPDRCILCMKCLDFMRNTAGTPELVLEGKGAQTRVKPFVNGAFSSPLSGNLIDICPAGALVNGRAELLTREWNIKRTETVDVLDPFLPEIRVDAAEGRIVAVKPVPAAGNGTALISDRTRFGIDGAASGRLDRPYIRVDGRFRECSWTEALMTAASKIKSAPPQKIAALTGTGADCESMAALSDMMKILGAKNIDATSPLRVLKTAGGWRFCNTPLSAVAKADALLIVGADPEREAPLLNAAIRANAMPKALIGQKTVQRYEYEHLGDFPDVLLHLAVDMHPFSSVMKRARFPMIVAGGSLWRRDDASAVFKLLSSLCGIFGVVGQGWNGFNAIGIPSGTLGASELGFVRKTPLTPAVRNGEFDVLYLSGEDGLTRADMSGAFVIYQGMFASETALAADVILPSLSYAEKTATYVGAFGRAKSTSRVLSPPGSAREDWKILRALSEYLEKPLPYDDLAGVRDRLGAVSAAFVSGTERPAEMPVLEADGALSEEPVASDDICAQNEICRRSPSLRTLRKVMGEKRENGSLA